MVPSSKHAAEPVVALSLDPPLLADLVRQQLIDRGLVVASSSTISRADVVLVNGLGPAEIEARIVVRLPDNAHVLPAAVEIEAGAVGVSRVVDVDDVEALVDLFVAVIRGSADV